ncbi:Vps45p KNAG_0M00470 [Huiozyma naganishii CBS 8797]|uniref:Sec1-like protein n=1 Tax=Huiozyma naganishii (strain ATCC MYA-139 / BCRC 22969 / CBS 8797 / KCTC 17520 / NBRC 10181 / NCYC 3082 / Yp74L-3) TaxID=1071383 RepID=J7RDE1_HUIN7|nr:hypothetical protein KNAG_0M00470 [Kazachstania naganishii CBS 8797]CCK72900.1 hypothetical protein KNAG_0M00470 [Kazachstania naganishii CBS 8797]
MDLFAVGDYYVGRIVNSQVKSGASFGTVDHESLGGIMDGSAGSPRVKVLLLDKNTTPTLSVCATQTELLEHEIYLIDTVENAERDVMRQLKCLVYVKPTDETLACLVRELQSPKYGEYHLFFNNFVSKQQLETLAEADQLEVVVKVEELFQDYQIINEHLFSLDLPRASSDLVVDTLVDESYMKQCKDSLLSLCMSLKVKPEIIRYDQESAVCKSLGKGLLQDIEKNSRSLFDFPQDPSTPPVLLLLDRFDDPLTPLLQPWTYQSMIHEYIGIKRNIVNLSKVPNIEAELETVTLSSKQDVFFHDTRYLNFGDLGDKLKEYVSTYKTTAQGANSVDTMDDIKEFIEKYPELKKLSGNVSKHMTIVGELDRQLKDLHIWELSEVEQNLTVHGDNNEDYDSTLNLLRDARLSQYYKLKLACIYMLRYDDFHPQEQNSGEIGKINEIFNILKESLTTEDINYLHKFRKFFVQRKNKALRNGTDASANRSPEKDDLLTELARKFNTKMDLHRSRLGAKRNATSDNVYMQHVPKLSQLLSDLSKNKLSETKYKYLNKSTSTPTNAPTQDVIIFIAGGVTYEESRFVDQFNEAMGNGGMRVVLGSSSIVSTHDFLNSLR